ncbi:MAG: hypothetical protein R3F07_17450 [Opitutaceae bacterium]
MRSAVVLLPLLLPLTSLVAGILPGDSAQDVRAELGVPNGSVEIGQTRILFFDRGEVVLREGVVADTNLLSESELVAKRAHEEERRNLLARVAEERRLLLESEGLALRQSKVDSPGFQSLPASERVAFWKQFQLRYPTVPVDLELGAALAQAKVEQAERDQRAARETALLYAGNWNRTGTSNSHGDFPYGLAYGAGIVIGGSHSPGYHPGRPAHPIPPIHPGRPPGGNRPPQKKSDHDFNSNKGAIMSGMDRARGKLDAGYSASRTAIYRSISP